MKKRFSTILVVFSCLTQPGKSQSLDSLQQIKSPAAQIYHSVGQGQQAKVTATRINNALAYFEKTLDYKPEVTLLILSRSDWEKYSSMRPVYGMPHYDRRNKTLYIAAEDNPFWNSFLPSLEKLPVELATRVKATYRTQDGKLSMRAFFDLLAIHELGHAFHQQNELTMQRKWMGELFVNILLHTYIAENEPALLPALTVFPQMVVAGGSSEYKYTTLQEVEDRYDEIALQYPKNYGWYQCRWHAGAALVYDAGGAEVSRKLWIALKINKEILDDKQFVTFLELSADKALADLIENWDEGNKKLK